MRTNPLSNVQLEKVRDTFEDIIDDPELRVSITYTRLTAESYDPSTGVQTRTETEDSVNAMKGMVSIREVERSGGRLQLGDRKYLVKQADLTGSPGINDRITDGSDTLEVVDWDEDRIADTYIVTARVV